jgi:hypothetical protein
MAVPAGQDTVIVLVRIRSCGVTYGTHKNTAITIKVLLSRCILLLIICVRPLASLPVSPVIQDAGDTRNTGPHGCDNDT